MPAGKDLPREAEDESSSEYTEVTEEELPAPETRSAAGKSGSFAPTPKPVVSEVPLASSESEDYVRPKGGRPKGEKPRVARTAATKRKLLFVVEPGKAKVFERKQRRQRQEVFRVHTLWPLLGTGQHGASQFLGPTPKVEPRLRDVAVPQQRPCMAGCPRQGSTQD